MKKRVTPAWLAFLLLVIVTHPLTAYGQLDHSFVHQVEVAEQALTFHTEGDFTAFTMTIAGPEAFYLHQQFAGDERPTWTLDPAAPDVASGAYRVQLTAHPRIPDAARPALEAARAAGDRSKIRALLAEAGIHPEQMVYTFGVGIEANIFLQPEGDNNEQVGDTTTLGSLDSAMPDPLTLVLPPSMPSSPFQYATQQRTEADASWIPASFKRDLATGQAALFQGLVRPAATQLAGYDQIYEGYFRLTGSNGQSEGTWKRQFFELKDGTIHPVDAALVAPASQTIELFDYTTGASVPPSQPLRDQVFNDDVIISGGSMCVGFDCVNGENFGFDTARLKENNLRIHFDDTSNSASFPKNDWRIRINDSTNGGASYYAIEDATHGRTPFRIEAGAPNNALYVEDDGDVGIGTSTPVVEVEAVDGNTPTVRLQQDGSQGFSSQTWDLAGNETNFFIRDATNGSKLPFRIQPNSAESSIFIKTNGVEFGNAALAQVGTAAAPGVSFKGDPNTGLHRPAEDNVALGTNGTETMRLDENGRIGVGVTDPEELVHLELPGTTSGLRLSRGTQDAYSLRILDGGLTFFNATDNLKELTMKGNGRIGILQPNPTVAFQVGGASDGTSALANAWNTFSDARYKEDVRPISEALEMVEAIDGVWYTWKESGDASLGFIAQELEQVLPHVVHTDDEGYKSVDYARLTAVLVEALKAQQALIEAQQADLASMDTRLNQFEAVLTQLQRQVQASAASATPAVTRTGRE